MAEPTFSETQLAQIEDLLETIPLAASLLQIARMLGFLTWERDDPVANDLETVMASALLTEGRVHDLYLPNRDWITTLLDGIAAIAGAQADQTAILEGILAIVSANLPVPVYPTPTSPSAVWDTVLTVGPAGADLTARTALTNAAITAHNDMYYGLHPVQSNADFAVTYSYPLAPLIRTFDYLYGIDVRARALGQSIGEYLSVVTAPREWELLGAFWVHYDDLINEAGITVWCMVPEVPPAEPPAVDLGPVQTAIDDVRGRARRYMPLPGEGTAGGGTVIAGEGRAALEPNTIAVLIDLPEIPQEWGQYGSEDPVYDSLGGYAFLSGGAFAGGGALRRAPNWLPVPPGADEIWWLLRPSLEGALTFVAGAPP